MNKLPTHYEPEYNKVIKITFFDVTLGLIILVGYLAMISYLVKGI